MDLLSISSTAIAVIAALVSLFSYYEMRKIAKIQTNLDLVNKGHDLVNEDPSLLKLHGISEQDLAQCGVNHKEFLYILNSFYAGQAYHSIEGAKKVVLSGYRKNMLDNEKVKQAWARLIRQKMMGESVYAKAIDVYYGL